jgi:hypothetical protein
VTAVDPEFFVHVLEQLLESAERGDPTAIVFLATPVIVFLVMGVSLVVLVAREMWVRRRKRLR